MKKHWFGLLVIGTLLIVAFLAYKSAEAVNNAANAPTNFLNWLTGAISSFFSSIFGKSNSTEAPTQNLQQATEDYATVDANNPLHTYNGQ